MTYDLSGLDAVEVALANEAIEQSVAGNAPGICIVLNSVRATESATERASILTRLRRVLFTERQLVAAQNMNDAWPPSTKP